MSLVDLDGFPRQLEGFQVQGNLSVSPHGDITYGGNGSIEASGTLFVDTISNYSFDNTSGILVQDNLLISQLSVLSYSTSQSFSSSSGSFILHGGLSIDNNTDASSVTSGGSITTAGGVSIGKQLHVGGESFFHSEVNMSSNKISNLVTPPVPDGLDAVNVDYLEDYTSNQFSSLLNNVSPNQIVLGGVSGQLSSYPSLTFDGEILALGSDGSLVLSNTSASSLVSLGGAEFNGPLTLSSTGTLSIENTADTSYNGFFGSFTTLGGATVAKNMYIGGNTFIKGLLDTNMQRITSVASPIEGFDAVNKIYVDALFQSVCDMCGGSSGGGGGVIGGGGDSSPSSPVFEVTTELQADVSIPTDIPDFSFSTAEYRAFVSFVYVSVAADKHAFFTIRGLLKNDVWAINTSFIGDSTGVNFYIRTGAENGILQYTNSSGSGICKFRTLTFINDFSSTQQELTLRPTSTPLDTGIFLSSNVLAVTSTLYVEYTTDVDKTYALFTIDASFVGHQWVMHSNFIGDETNVRFFITTSGDIGSLKYVNTNASDAHVRFKDTRIFNSTQQFILDPNVVSPSQPLPELQFGDNNEYTNQFKLLVQVPNDNTAAFYTLNGLLNDNRWEINSRFIGDPLGVTFSMLTDGTVGTLHYTNQNPHQAIIKFLEFTPTPYVPPSVGSGGTGVTSFYQDAVLRGNGSDPILGTPDFIYKDFTLTLAEQSSILIQNPTNALNGTTGSTFTTYGGASIAKDLFVDSVNITPSQGDIVKEQAFSASDNVTAPSDVMGFAFDTDIVRSFHALVSVEVYSDSTNLFACYDIHGINKDTEWSINQRFIGDDTGVRFYVDSNDDYGQLQYTSTSIPNWNSTLVKFRALTTSK